MDRDDEFSEEDITVSMRVECMPTPAVPGSSTRSCKLCGSDVWISPATKRAIERGDYPDRVVCVRCATDDEDEDE